MFFNFRGLLLVLCFEAARACATEANVAIRTDFAGGNVVVIKNEGDTIELAPDLRGGPSWFYWHFEAEAVRAGNVTFSLAKAPLVGVRGPAVSHDGGRSWQWLGADQVTFAAAAVAGDKSAVRHDRFTFTFTEARQKVRFAVAIPYLQRELDAFLAEQKGNPHLTRSVLTETRVDHRPVHLLQIGKPGPGVHAVLLTARHHACESMASYVLEGFLRESAVVRIVVCH